MREYRFEEGLGESDIQVIYIYIARKENMNWIASKVIHLCM